MRSLLPLLMLLLGASGPQEEAASTPRDPSDPGARAVVELTRLETRAVADRKALEALSSDLAETLDGLDEPLPDPPPTLGEMDFAVVDRVEPLIEESRAYLEAWRVREERRARALDLVGSGAGLADGLAEAWKGWYARALELRPALIDLQRRISAGETSADSVGIEPGSVQRVLASTAERMDSRQEDLREVRELADRFALQRAAVEALPSEDAEAVRFAERLALALRTIGEAIAAEGDLLARLEAAPPETLTEEIERLLAEWEARRSSASTAAEEFDAVLERFRELRRERAERPVPAAGATPSGDEPEGVRRARRDVDVAERRIAYYEGDLNLARRLAEARDALVAAGERARERHGALSRQTARVLASMRLTEERLGAGWEPPEGAEVGTVWDAWRFAQVAAADRAEALDDAREAAVDEAARKDVEARLEDERETLRRARSRLETELSHAEFVRTMQERSDEELLELLASDAGVAAQLAELEERFAAAREELAEATRACVDVAGDLGTIESPYSRDVLVNREGDAVLLRDVVAALGEGQVPEDRSDELVPERSELRERMAPGADDMGSDRSSALEIAVAEEKRLVAQQAFAGKLLSYYSRLLAARERLEALAEDRRALGERLEELAAERLRLVKMRYAAANELARRGLDEEVESADAERWRGTSAVSAANEALREVRRGNADFSSRAGYLFERLTVITALEPVVRAISEGTDRRAALIGQPVSHVRSAQTPIDELSRVEVDDLRFRSRVRRAEEEPWLARLAKRFTSDEVVQRFEEPLDTFHLELANLDRVIAELTRAGEAYERIAEAWDADLERMAPLEDLADALLVQRVFDYHAARYAAAAARHPGARSRVEEAFRQAFGRELTYRLDVQAPTADEAADALFDAEVRLVAQRAFRSHLVRLLSKAGVQLEAVWYRDQAAVVRSMLERTRRERAALREKIDERRASYHDRLRSNATIGVAITLAIPFFAWLLVRSLRRFSQRFEYDGLGELGEHDSDRKRRLRTVARTLTAALTVLVWLVAAVYVFAQLGLDITPIVASASVVGLAVAFGAQALIKDFFSGFFILLENQFTVGDIVQLGAVSGTVEKISLRITIVRDLEGIVHYIPNGSIGQVSNKTQGWARVVFEVSVPYREDPDRACEILRDELRLFYADPDWGGPILEPPVVAGVENLTERSIDIRVMIKVRPGRQWEVAREARRRIKRRLDREGIENPFPHRVVHHVQEGVGPVSSEERADD